MLLSGAVHRINERLAKGSETSTPPTPISEVSIIRHAGGIVAYTAAQFRSVADELIDPHG